MNKAPIIPPKQAICALAFVIGIRKKRMSKFNEVDKNSMDNSKGI